MSTDVYTCTPAGRRLSPRMRASRRADIVSVCVLVVFAVVVAVALRDQHPPRVLDDSRIQRVQ